MIQVTFQFETLQDLYDFTAAQLKPILGGAAPGLDSIEGQNVVVLAPAEASTPATKPRKPKAPPVAAVAEPAATESAPAADIEAVRAAIVAVNDKFGLVPARRVLKKFGVARVTELKPEQYAEFVKACGEVK